MKLHIDHEENIAYIRLAGHLNKTAILQAFDLAVSDKRYRAGMSRLWDFRTADLSMIDNETIYELAQHSKKYPPGINNVKVAFVTSTDLNYGLTRMFEMMSKAATPISAFRDMTAAERWLAKDV